MTAIIVYSIGKKMKFVSKIIAQKSNSELIEVKDLNKKDEGILNSIKKSFTGFDTKIEIEPPYIDFSDYDLILIGSPSNSGKISPAISTIIDNCDFKNKNIIIYTTSTSRHGYDVLNRMKKKIEEKNAYVLNSFIIKIGNKSDDELKINTLKILKELDLDLYT